MENFFRQRRRTKSSRQVKVSSQHNTTFLSLSLFPPSSHPPSQQHLKTLSGSITKLTEVANKTVLTQKQEQLLSSGAREMASKQQQQQAKKEALKEKAEALRKEVSLVDEKTCGIIFFPSLPPQAHQLGLLSSPSQPLPPGGGGAGAGRGRGKSDLRGKLHSKPRQLLVIGAKDRDQLTQYFEVKEMGLLLCEVTTSSCSLFTLLPVQSFGGLDSVGVDPGNGDNLVFTFRSSGAANQVWLSIHVSSLSLSLSLPLSLVSLITLLAAHTTTNTQELISPFFSFPQVVSSSSTFQGKPIIMKWYSPKPPGAPTTTITPATAAAAPVASLHTTTTVSSMATAAGKGPTPAATAESKVTLERVVWGSAKNFLFLFFLPSASCFDHAHPVEARPPGTALGGG